jgi:hypothetical protein
MINDLQIGTVVFTDINGIVYTMKDIRPIEPAATFFEVPKSTDELLDSVAVRTEVFGEGGENKVWKLFDQNAVALVDANFDLTQLRKIRVPVE